ncbi:amidase family protein [Catenuloplanes nepalensis]|uniref:amidase family protein n=1 Tax=Catenuloplanes nepalensis TaxID=587533 RepID=UPI0027D88591|nr:amidase family protein [Catenuloplanes nepalensis]
MSRSLTRGSRPARARKPSFRGGTSLPLGGGVLEAPAPNFRSTEATEGWSGVGGQTRNPYSLSHSQWGSPSGSAVAVACGMAPLAIGTGMDGSIVGPAGVCGVVGVKPERGRACGNSKAREGFSHPGCGRVVR